MQSNEVIFTGDIYIEYNISKNIYKYIEINLGGVVVTIQRTLICCIYRRKTELHTDKYIHFAFFLFKWFVFIRCLLARMI